MCVCVCVCVCAYMLHMTSTRIQHDAAPPNSIHLWLRIAVHSLNLRHVHPWFVSWTNIVLIAQLIDCLLWQEKKAKKKEAKKVRACACVWTNVHDRMCKPVLYRMCCIRHRAAEYVSTKICRSSQTTHTRYMCTYGQSACHGDDFMQTAVAYVVNAD